MHFQFKVFSRDGGFSDYNPIVSRERSIQSAQQQHHPLPLAVQVPHVVPSPVPSAHLCSRILRAATLRGGPVTSPLSARRLNHRELAQAAQLLQLVSDGVSLYHGCLYTYMCRYTSMSNLNVYAVDFLQIR